METTISSSHMLVQENFMIKSREKKLHDLTTLLPN